MEKYSESKVRPAKHEQWDGKSKVVRYAITEVEDAEGGVKYEFREVLVEELTRDAVIGAIIRAKYSVDDEIALAFGREKDAEEIAEHEAFVAQAKVWADEVLA